MKALDLSSFTRKPKSAVIPPLANSLRRYADFIANGDSVAKKSFTDHLIEKKKECTVWGIDTTVNSIMRAGGAYLKDPLDEYARTYIAGTRISEKLGVKLLKKNKKKYLSIDFLGQNISLISLDTSQDKFPNPSIHSNESKAQDRDLDLFMILAAFSAIPQSVTLVDEKVVAIFDLLDVFDFALARLIFLAKRSSRIPRPWTQDELDMKFGVDMVKIPEHSSWPGGHAYRSGALAQLLFMIISPLLNNSEQKDLAETLEIAACRIATNRERIGLHWKTDTMAGLQLGSDCVKGIVDYLSDNQKDVDSDLSDALGLFHLIHS